ncbi:MAG: flagellar hook-associated protein FlgK [Lachnospiraceae bacterium]|nr:flagellar hook-associated protein FlgK [Lachnospiraceae bacterium]
MPNSFFGLTIGSSGLFSSNINLNTTAHNIANVETEGYSRQLTDQRASNPLRAFGSYGMIGTGSDILSIERRRNEYYDTKYRSNSCIGGYYDSQIYYMKSVEDYFNEIQLEGFNTTFNKFYDSLQELSKDPSSLSVRTEVNSFSQSFCEFVNSLSTSLEKLQEGCNFEIKSQVDTVNSLAVQITGLTRQINALEVTGEKANDLRDQRDLLVDELSRIFTISVKEEVVGDDVGVTSYTIKIGDNTLVDTYECQQLKAVPRTDKLNQSDINGLYDLQWSNGQSFNPLVNGGSMQAIFEVRDGNNQVHFEGRSTASYGDTHVFVTDTSVNKIEQLHIAQTGIINIGNREYTYNGFQVTEDADGKFVYEFALDEELRKDVDDIDVAVGKSIKYKGIAYYMQQLDEFTRVFSKEYNDIVRTGVDLNNEPALDYFNSTDLLTGENFVFERSEDDIDNEVIFSSKTGDFFVEEEDKNYGSYYLMTAGRFGVTKAVYDDPSKVTTAVNMVDGVEQNDIIMQLIALKNKVSMFKQGSPSGFLQSLVAELGVDTSKSAAFSENQADIIATIANQRLSVSGVDIDEEAMSLVRFQNAYNLSSKVISTMNEIYNKLINETGV